MCRWAAYVGTPIFMEDVISLPQHSLVAQSVEAHECKTSTNGDGFGLAWYDHRPEPGLYRDVYPAWSDPNLRALSNQVKSRLFLSHVRASTGSAISRNNCHPFCAGKWSFMHNGQVGGFESFRRYADMCIPDDLYEHRKGATDSEVLFLIALKEGLATNPLAALEKAVAKLEQLSRKRGCAPHMRLSAAFSDGEVLYAARYSSDHIAPSLYYRWNEVSSGWTVVSEPLEAEQEGWTELKPGQFLVLKGEEVRIEAFDPTRHDIYDSCPDTA